MRTLIAAALFALLLANPSAANAPAGCLDQSASPYAVSWERKETGTYELAQTQLCCCTAWNGGLCCNHAPMCGGIVPGCICR